ncbi:unnamed protein product [Closterium sp. Naga37s-1]|nr:unnamed protein product [Closterium sp. Naga37s-1]
MALVTRKIPKTMGLRGAAVDRTSLREVETRLTLDIHPSRSGNVVAGVKEQLNNSLMRYSEQHGGIVLAYSNVLLFGRTAAILTGLNPYLHVSLSARLLLFAPRPGAFLEGVVNNVGADFIGLLVLGVFNAAVPDQFMRSWKHVEEEAAADDSDNHGQQQHWQHKEDPSHRIFVGSRIRVQVDSATGDGTLMSIRGSLDWTIQIRVHFTFSSLAHLPFLFPPPTSFLPPSRSPPSDTHSNLYYPLLPSSTLPATTPRKKRKADQAAAAAAEAEAEAATTAGAGTIVLAEPKTPVPTGTTATVTPEASPTPSGDAGGKKKKKHKADQAGALGAMVLAEPRAPVAPGTTVSAAPEASPAPSIGGDAGGKKKKRKVKEGDVSAAHTATATPPSAVKVAGGKKAKKAAAGSS